MKKSIGICTMAALCTLVLAVLCSCNAFSRIKSIETIPPNADTHDIAAATATLDSVMMKLALEENPDDAAFYSPYGAASAFAMLADAAGDGTPIADDVTSALGYSDLEQMNADFKGANELAPLDGGYGFSSAGLILYDEANLAGEVALDEEIASWLNAYLATEVRSEDFAGNLDRAKRDIQVWVSNATQGFIDDFESKADETTATDILNAVYFKGKWSLPFEENRTREGTFTSSSGAEQRADLMYKIFENPRDVAYYEDSHFKGIRLDYKDAAEPISMYVILPVEENATDCARAWANATDAYKAEFKAHLDDDGMDYDELRVSLPKLEFRQGTDITKVANMIGVGSALSGGALKLFGDGVSGVEIEQIYQDAKVRIDEEGTEAAAVTEIRMVATSEPVVEVVKTFYCNRPYVFMIAGKSNDVTYFTGLVNSIEPDMRIDSSR